MSRRSFFTTFEVSEICEVNPTTVQNWVKENKLKAYATPGGHRRIRRSDLVTFLKHFGMPLPAELARELPLVLIVDDEEEIREMLAAAMRSWDARLEVTTAPGGVEALVAVGERKPDLLVLDLLMPGLNGIEVCRRLKAHGSTRGVRIVAITGVEDQELRQRALEAGADLFFTKPLDLTAFRQGLLELLPC
jgi:excisionase family DNA binding protein